MANILITGISRGLGLEITKKALDEGYTIFGICRALSDELQILKNKFPNHLHILYYDLANYKDIKQDIIKDFIGDNSITAFVNNAAKAYDTLLTNMNADEVIDMTIVNQISPMVLTKYVIRNMILHDIKGSIVHISSITAHTGYKGLAMYGATKGALEAFSKSAAREWGSRGIRSNCVAVGFMNTDMTKSMDVTMKEKVFNRTCLKQATREESVAATVMFLLSNDAASITGQVLHVDSGTI